MGTSKKKTPPPLYNDLRPAEIDSETKTRVYLFGLVPTNQVKSEECKYNAAAEKHGKKAEQKKQAHVDQLKKYVRDGLETILDATQEEKIERLESENEKSAFKLLRNRVTDKLGILQEADMPSMKKTYVFISRDLIDEDKNLKLKAICTYLNQVAGISQDKEQSALERKKSKQELSRTPSSILGSVDDLTKLALELYELQLHDPYGEQSRLNRKKRMELVNRINDLA